MLLAHAATNPTFFCTFGASSTKSQMLPMCAVSYKHAACSIAISALICNNPTFYRVLGVLAFNNPTCCSAFIFRKATFSCTYRALTSKTPAFFLTFSALIFKHATFFSIFDAFIFQNATFSSDFSALFFKNPFFQYVLCTHLKHASFSSIFNACFFQNPQKSHIIERFIYHVTHWQRGISDLLQCC